MAAQMEINQPKLNIVEQTNEEEERLKYLEFVQGVAVEVVLRFALLYRKTKDKSGPLKQGVKSVEGAAKTEVDRVYEKYHDVPVEVLKYMDHKVEDSVIEDEIDPIAEKVVIEMTKHYKVFEANVLSKISH